MEAITWVCARTGNQTPDHPVHGTTLPPAEPHRPGLNILNCPTLQGLIGNRFHPPTGLTGLPTDRTVSILSSFNGERATVLAGDVWGQFAVQDADAQTTVPRMRDTPGPGPRRSEGTIWPPPSEASMAALPPPAGAGTSRPTPPARLWAPRACPRQHPSPE